MLSISSETNSLGESTELLDRNTSSNSKLDPYEFVAATLTAPPWLILTLYAIVGLVYYLRSIQYFRLYDKCIHKNAHFRYDFHLVFGRHTNNYLKYESQVIIDLLDNNNVSTYTITIPGTTIYNENQVFTNTSSRSNLRTVRFSVYRRHPLRDIKSIRIAHTCNLSDARFFAYGLSLYDKANNESKFFPFLTPIKYRGTHWALSTTFEARNDIDFDKLGCASHDPYVSSSLPTYLELLSLLFATWGLVVFVCYLITVESIGSLAAHIPVVVAIVSVLVIFYCLSYFWIFKTRLDNQKDGGAYTWFKIIMIILELTAGTVFFIVASNQLEQPYNPSIDWVVSCAISGCIVTAIMLIVLFAIKWQRLSRDRTVLSATDDVLKKNSSKPSMDFVEEPCLVSQQRRQDIIAGKISNPARSHPRGKSTQTQKRSATQRRKGDSRQNRTREDDENLEQAYTDSGNAYMRTKDRNSISQYV